MHFYFCMQFNAQSEAVNCIIWVFYIFVLSSSCQLLKVSKCNCCWIGLLFGTVHWNKSFTNKENFTFYWSMSSKHLEESLKQGTPSRNVGWLMWFSIKYFDLCISKKSLFSWSSQTLSFSFNQQHFSIYIINLMLRIIFWVILKLWFLLAVYSK